MFLFQNESMLGARAAKPKLEITDAQLNAIAGNKDWSKTFGISPLGIGAAVATAAIFNGKTAINIKEHLLGPADIKAVKDYLGRDAAQKLDENSIEKINSMKEGERIGLGLGGRNYIVEKAKDGKLNLYKSNALEYFIAACEIKEKNVMRNPKAAAVIANMYWSEICDAYSKDDRGKIAWDNAWESSSAFREDIVSRRCSLDNSSEFLRSVANGIGEYCADATKRANSEGATFGNVARRFLTPGGWADGLMWLPYNGVINAGAALGFGNFRAETPPYGTMMNDVGKGIASKVAGGKWYDIAQAPLYFLAEMTSIPAWIDYSKMKEKMVENSYAMPAEINLVSNQYMQAWIDAAFTATIVGGTAMKAGKSIGEKLMFERARYQAENYIARRATSEGLTLEKSAAEYANDLINPIERKFFDSRKNAGKLYEGRPAKKYEKIYQGDDALKKQHPGEEITFGMREESSKMGPLLDRPSYKKNLADWYSDMKQHNQYRVERKMENLGLPQNREALGEYISREITKNSKLMANPPFGEMPTLPFPITGMAVQVPSVGKMMVKGVVEGAKTLGAWTAVAAERTFAIPVRKLAILEGYGFQMKAWLDEFKSAAADKIFQSMGATGTKSSRKALENKIGELIAQGEARHSQAIITAFDRECGFAGSLDKSLASEASKFEAPSGKIVAEMRDKLAKYYTDHLGMVGDKMSLEAQVELDIYKVLDSAVKGNFARIRGEIFRIYKVGFAPAPMRNEGYMRATLRNHVLETAKTSKFEPFAQMLSRTQFREDLLGGATVKEAATLRELGKATGRTVGEVLIDPLKLPRLKEMKQKLTAQRATIEERIRVNTFVIERIGLENSKNPLLNSMKKLETQQSTLKGLIDRQTAKKKILEGYEHPNYPRIDAYGKAITDKQKRLDAVEKQIKETKKELDVQYPEIKTNLKKQKALVKENEALNNCSRYLKALEESATAEVGEITKAYVKTSYNSFLARGFEGAPGWIGAFDKYLARNNLKGSYSTISREIDEIGKSMDVIRGRVNKQYDAWLAEKPRLPQGSSYEKEFISDMYARAGGKVKDDVASAVVSDMEALSKLAPAKTYRAIKLGAITGLGIGAIGGVGALIWFYPKQAADVGLAVGLTITDFYALGVSTKLAGGEGNLLGLITAFSAAHSIEGFAGSTPLNKSMEIAQAARIIGLTVPENELLAKVILYEETFQKGKDKVSLNDAFFTDVGTLSSIRVPDKDKKERMAEDAKNTIRMLAYVQNYMKTKNIAEPDVALIGDLIALGDNQAIDALVPPLPEDRQAQLNAALASQAAEQKKAEEQQKQQAAQPKQKQAPAPQQAQKEAGGELTWAGILSTLSDADKQDSNIKQLVSDAALQEKFIAKVNLLMKKQMPQKGAISTELGLVQKWGTEALD